MSAGQKFPRALAIQAAKPIIAAMSPHCSRIIVAGSLRRRREMVGDVEILYIPRFVTQPDPRDFFSTIQVNLAAQAIEDLIATGVLKFRPNINGSIIDGDLNKLCVHVDTGVPVDLFRATDANWFNYLVCRTGGLENNKAIAYAAITRGLRWHPYNQGFTTAAGEWLAVHSEEDVYRLAGLPYLQPHDRR